MASDVMLDLTPDKWANMKRGKMSMHEPEGSSGEYFGPEVMDVSREEAILSNVYI